MSIFSKDKTDDILSKALDGIRITSQEALQLMEKGDFYKIGYTANKIRSQFLPLKQASYTIFCVINYTNYCNVECKFCSFMDEINSKKGYVLSLEQILKKMELGQKKVLIKCFYKGVSILLFHLIII